MIWRRHNRCTICDWLAREAERTATKQGKDQWSSYDIARDGTEHAAHYLAEHDHTEKEQS